MYLGVPTSVVPAVPAVLQQEVSALLAQRVHAHLRVHVQLYKRQVTTSDITDILIICRDQI